MNLPESLRYTSDHEWLQERDGGVVRVGITDYAQDALGDVVFVSLPEPGRAVNAGDSCAEVESTKSVSEVYAPVTGTVQARNEALEGSPERVNTDPYGEGWLFEIRLAAGGSLAGLLDAAGYRGQLPG